MTGIFFFDGAIKDALIKVRDKIESGEYDKTPQNDAELAVISDVIKYAAGNVAVDIIVDYSLIGAIGKKFGDENYRQDVRDHFAGYAEVGIEQIRGLVEGIEGLGTQLAEDPIGLIVTIAEEIGEKIADPVGTVGDYLNSVKSTFDTATKDWGEGGEGQGKATLNVLVEVGKAVGAAKILKDVVTKAVKKAGTAAEKAAIRAEAESVAKGSSEGCFTAGTLVGTATGLKVIESINVGDRVLTKTITDDAQPSQTDVDPTSWRQITLKLFNEQFPADVLNVVLLRPVDWVAATGAAARARIWLDLEDIGLTGWATVQSVEPCPDIKPGIGRVVLATYTHYNNDVYELQIEGQEKPLEPTGLHRLYSATRGDWIRTEDLVAGEKLKTRTGAVTVASISQKSGSHRVYNLEVEGEHVYFTSEGEILGHNQGCIVTGEELKKVRREFESTKPKLWKKEAELNSEKYSPSQLDDMRRGKAPIGSDGEPMEVHHKQMLSHGGSNDFENCDFMTQFDHRRGPNYRKNHPRD